jgi:Ca-activated chloride channel family protein
VVSLTSLLRLAAIALAIGNAGGFAAAIAAEPKESPCNDDAMIVFDASGSMAGNVGQGIATTIPRIDEARHALAEVLPSATKFRRVGLITYGPGPYQQCNVHLDLKPTANAGAIIMQTVNALTPGGRTPLASAVEQAAEVLDYRNKPGVIVVVTDGEETCGGAPCDLGKKLHAAAKQLRSTSSAIALRISLGQASKASSTSAAWQSKMVGSTSPPSRRKTWSRRSGKPSTVR